MAVPFTVALKQAQQEISARLNTLIPVGATLGKPMLHAVMGGKMLRGFLVLESARLHGVEPKVALDAAVAIECIHAYSLVHDDLPCMDDDDLRRGLPTIHKKWDEATAVLTGDALQTMAFDLLADAKFGPHALELIRLMARAAGRSGMVQGQMLDIDAETATTPLTLDQITRLQNRKTGCLINWSATVGPVISGDDPSALTQYATALGLAFQIADDILDIEGDAQKVGKALRKDANAGKATFVSLLGLEPAKQRARDLVDEACSALAPYGDEGETLKQTARFVIARDS
ncbi:polyprenyl synthetase family protein [Pseudophaeobacter arcticus]|uniref:polyprenyl synthetase family protein n=1 Tax=Pseudophaeobacter arcticus TaxID=385492 RepID=UPI003A980857